MTENVFCIVEGIFLLGTMVIVAFIQRDVRDLQVLKACMDEFNEKLRRFYDKKDGK